MAAALNGGRTRASGRVARRLRELLKRATWQRQRIARRRTRAAERALADLARWPTVTSPAPHGLPGPLLVSLTSHAPRFPFLDRTLKSLLDQTVAPDRLILWLADADAPALTDAVRALVGKRLEVRTCADLRSFKKILPALVAFPDHFIVTADDDVHYPANWLATLIAAYDPARPTVVCHRAHRITYTRDGRIAPYRRWQREVRDARSCRPATDLVPTGNGGVLYPPGALPPATSDLGLIEQLSPTCDDTWLYFMWRQAGWSARRSGATLDMVDWPDAQAQALCRFHRGGAKDRYLQAMAAHFGHA